MAPLPTPIRARAAALRPSHPHTLHRTRTPAPAPAPTPAPTPVPAPGPVPPRPHTSPRPTPHQRPHQIPRGPRIALPPHPPAPRPRPRPRASVKRAGRTRPPSPGRFLPPPPHPPALSSACVGWRGGLAATASAAGGRAATPHVSVGGAGSQPPPPPRGGGRPLGVVVAASERLGETRRDSERLGECPVQHRIVRAAGTPPGLRAGSGVARARVRAPAPPTHALFPLHPTRKSRLRATASRRAALHWGSDAGDDTWRRLRASTAHAQPHLLYILAWMPSYSACAASIATW